MVRFIRYIVGVLAFVPALTWAAWAETPYIVDSPYYTYKLESAKMQPDGSISATRSYVRRVQPPAIYTGPQMPSKLNIKSIVTAGNVARLLRGASMAGLAIWAYEEFMDKHGLLFDSNGDIAEPGYTEYRGSCWYRSGYYWSGVSKNISSTKENCLAYLTQHSSYPKPFYFGGQQTGSTWYTWTIHNANGSTIGDFSISKTPAPVEVPGPVISDSELIEKFREFDKQKGGTQLPKLLQRPDGLAIRTPDAIGVEEQLRDQWNDQTGDNLDGVTANNPDWDTDYYNPDKQLNDPQIGLGTGTGSTTVTTNPDGSTTITTTNPDSPESPELPLFCEWAAVVCEFFNWYQEPPELEEHPDLMAEPVDIEAPSYNSGLGGGSCPAPITVDLGQYGNFSIEWNPLCQLAGMLRPFFLALFYLGGLYIVVRS